MKLDRVKVSMVALVIVLFTPAALLAQDDKGDKGDKDKKDKEMQQIIITRKSDKDEKVVIEVKGDKVTVNGK